MTYRRSTHSVYDIEYHIVFCTTYRYRMLYGNIAERCIEVIKEVCSANYVDIINGKSSRKLQGEFPELRKRYWGTASKGKRVFCSNIWTDKREGDTKIYRRASGTP